MAAQSDYLEDQLVDHIFRTSSFTKPTTLAIALCTSAPSDTDTGALSGKEVANSNGYSRQTLNPDDANWSEASSGSTSNQSVITFGPATGGGWGTITHVAITDSATHGGGNLLFYGALNTSKAINVGESFTFSVGGLTIQVDN